MTGPTAGVMTGDERPSFPGVPEDEAMAFVAGLADIPWLHPDGEPDPAWRLFATRSDALAAWNAAWDARAGGEAANAALTAAWDASDAAARKAAVGSASDAAWDAAWSVMLDAAYDVGYDVGYEVAYDAAYDAALMAAVLVCGGLPVEARHVEHARARMRVWEKGYGLVGDLDGELYVYEREA